MKLILAILILCGLTGYRMIFKTNLYFQTNFN